MNQKVVRFIAAFATLVVVILWIQSCGKDPVKPGSPPRITRFTATPSDILPGDSSLLEYTVTGADSVRLMPDGVKLTPASSGSRWVKPSRPTVYSLTAYNKDGTDLETASVTMSGAMPLISRFELTQDTILIGDSTALIWKTFRTDSISINNGLGRMINADTGGIVVKPNISTSYRATAYNQFGVDTATVAARVEVPYAVNALYGSYFKGVMGGGIQGPQFRFRILDQAGETLRKPWLFFSIVEGDGALLIDSSLPDAGGGVTNNYTFSGRLGYGLVRALVRNVDTLDVKIRASVIRFGADGQGQYIKLYDTYADVVALDGQPASIDHPVPADPYYYINYEQALGVVPIVFDGNGDGIVQNTEHVFEVIMNSVFTGTSEEGIGIGSGINSVRAAYGAPNNFFYDPSTPPAWGMEYDTLGAIFYASTTPPDSAIIEIHVWEPTLPSPAGLKSRPAIALGRQRPHGIRYSGWK